MARPHGALCNMQWAMCVAYRRILDDFAFKWAATGQTSIKFCNPLNQPQHDVANVQLAVDLHMRLMYSCYKYWSPYQPLHLAELQQRIDTAEQTAADKPQVFI
eukprot:355506-Chlamydomonas_euryale.AAC.1